MKAFHGKQEIKDKFVANAKWHQDMDKFVQGQDKYDADKKGCMIACSFHRYDHELAPIEAGVPVWLAKLADRIFEGLSRKESDLWTLRFWEAINVGANLEKVKAPFFVFVLQSTFDTFDHARYPKIKEAIDAVIALYESGETDVYKFQAARRAAAAYAAADTYVVYAAAYAAYAADAAAAYAAAYAAYAVDAVDAAGAADTYAADAAADAYAADAATAATAATAYAAADIRKARYKMFADKLIELLKAEVQSGGPHG